MRKSIMLLDSKKAAVKLKISYSHMKLLLYNNTIKSKMVGHSYIIDPEDESFKNFKRKRKARGKSKNA